MKKRVKLLHRFFVTAVVLIFMVIPALPAYAADTAELRVTVNYKQSEARKQLDLINSVRTSGSAWYYNPDGSKYWCGALAEMTYDYQLEQLAMKRAREIVISYSHARPDGTGLRELHEGCEWYGIAENIAVGTGGSISRAETVHNLFMEDDQGYAGQGHRRNILGDYTSFGSACVEYGGSYFWVQEFRTPNSGAAYTEPNNSAQTGTVNVLPSYISGYSFSFDGNDIALEVGGSAALPTGKLMATVPETWSYNKDFEVVANISASSDNTGVAKIDGSRIVAVGAGSAKITVTASAGGKSYSNSITVSVKGVDFKDSLVSLSQGTYTYDGGAKTPAVTVELGGRMLTNGRDYSVSYSNNVNAGKANVTVSGMGEYSGKSISREYLIVPRSIEDFEVIINTDSWGSVTLKNGSQTIPSDQYTVSTSDEGTGLKKVTVSGRNNYTGSIDKYFTTGSSGTRGMLTGSMFTHTSSGQKVRLENANVTLTDAAGNLCAIRVSGNSFSASVTPGSYTLTVSKKGYASRRYNVDVTSGADLSVEIAPLGDINNDGSVDISDAVSIINDINGNFALSGYSMSAADVDRDGEVSIADAAAIINQINGLAPLG